MEFRSLADERPERVLDLWTKSGLPHRPLGRDSPRRLGADFAMAPDLNLGGYEGGQLIGTVIATDDGRKGWINRLAVVPEHRRKGVGTRLLEEAERRLQERGRRIIGALVEDWNEGSLEFFRARGYRLHEDIHYLSKRESDEV